ncbi:unnamed protein product [Haemonchus placei]|uniref:Uncharacterized protein n=1 Tax=Haemonchus placei TaxID=6290 RepID=A0A0N4WUW2_HAEPC|nr:unnamed protein product [Haemonchus placei]
MEIKIVGLRNVWRYTDKPRSQTHGLFVYFMTVISNCNSSYSKFRGGFHRIFFPNIQARNRENTICPCKLWGTLQRKPGTTSNGAERENRMGGEKQRMKLLLFTLFTVAVSVVRAHEPLEDIKDEVIMTLQESPETKKSLEERIKVYDST